MKFQICLWCLSQIPNSTLRRRMFIINTTTSVEFDQHLWCLSQILTNFEKSVRIWLKHQRFWSNFTAFEWWKYKNSFIFGCFVSVITQHSVKSADLKTLVVSDWSLMRTTMWWQQVTERLIQNQQLLSLRGHKHKWVKSTLGDWMTDKITTELFWTLDS